jgi:hypothetical protein
VTATDYTTLPRLVISTAVTQGVGNVFGYAWAAQDGSFGTGTVAVTLDAYQSAHVPAVIAELHAVDAALSADDQTRSLYIQTGSRDVLKEIADRNRLQFSRHQIGSSEMTVVMDSITIAMNERDILTSAVIDPFPPLTEVAQKIAALSIDAHVKRSEVQGADIDTVMLEGLGFKSALTNA